MLGRKKLKTKGSSSDEIIINVQGFVTNNNNVKNAKKKNSLKSRLANRPNWAPVSIAFWIHQQLITKTLRSNIHIKTILPKIVTNIFLHNEHLKSYPIRNSFTKFSISVVENVMTIRNWNQIISQKQRRNENFCHIKRIKVIFAKKYQFKESKSERKNKPTSKSNWIRNNKLINFLNFARRSFSLVEANNCCVVNNYGPDGPDDDEVEHFYFTPKHTIILLLLLLK